jgi:hypothetical protein
MMALYSGMLGDVLRLCTGLVGLVAATTAGVRFQLFGTTAVEWPHWAPL